MERATATIVDYIDDLNFNSLSEDVIDRAKYLALDYIGLAVGGQGYRSTEILRHSFQRKASGGKGTIFGTDETNLTEYAALINGASAHTLELDDTSNMASLHPAVAVFPAAFAVSEANQLSGKDFIVAAVSGYELMVRLGTALDPADHYKRGFHPTSTCGVFGAAVTASKLAKLDKQAMARSLGIAASQSAGSMIFLRDGAWTKRFHPGWATHSGILAMEMASNGFVGSEDAFDGEPSFLTAYSGKPSVEKLTEGLGVYPPAMMETSIKPHACCRYNQGPIDAVLALVIEHDIQPQDVVQINTRVVGTAVPIVCEPLAEKRAPKTVVDAQFSLPFSLSVATIYRQASLPQFSETVLTDDQVLDMMQKVTYERGQDLEANFPKEWPSEVSITLQDGRVLTKRIDTPKGEPNNPLSWAELIEKFKTITGGRLQPDVQDKVVKIVTDLENLDDISELTSLLQVRQGALI